MKDIILHIGDGNINLAGGWFALRILPYQRKQKLYTGG